MDFFFEMLKVVFLGIVEGITEWLPISSTGHMILVDEFVHLNVTEDFFQMFLVVIQLGAILAVVVIYWSKLWPFHRKRMGQKSAWAQISDKKVLGGLQRWLDKYADKGKIILWLKILVSCLPAMIIGLPFNDWIELHLNNYAVVSIALIVYGVLFIVIENYNKTRTASICRMRDITFKTALLIGVFQVLALVPGTSRSGATIVGGILLGASRQLAAQYTFYLAIPVMFGASLLKLLSFGFSFTGQEAAILLVGYGSGICGVNFGH